MRTVLLAAAIGLALGCTSEPPSQQDCGDGNQTSAPRVEHGEATPTLDLVDKSFGIANAFSGKLSEEQERVAPEPLRGAFTIESLRTITITDLERELQLKTQIAEETHEGKRYVALKDFRCVQFSDELSGQMIVIERYLVAPK